MNTDTFIVTGGKQLKGNIQPQGAKNEALQILAATLLSDQKITISNIPDIIDVRLLLDLLAGLGVKVEKINKDTYSFQADEIDLEYIQSVEFNKKARRIRGSVLLIGPLLTRFGKAYL